jgi:ABC-type Zn uptake system ZnuABC Zn-binding protein ZnuA
MTRSFAARPVEQKPATIIIAILTDGEENASHEYTAQHIADLIEAKKELGWKFIFLAANQDAIATATALRNDAADALNFVSTQAGTATAFRELSNKVTEKRRK